MPQHQASSSRSSATSLDPSQLGSQTHVLDCRWGWCRFSASSDADLVEHVVQEHVQNATPVRRRDIPLLRRAEEGIGESLSLSLKRMMGGSYDMVGSRPVNDGDATDRDLSSSPRPLSPAHTQASSLPSPPGGSPCQHDVFKSSPSASPTSDSPTRSEANKERLRLATPTSFLEPEHRPAMPPPAHSRPRVSHSPSTPNFPFTSFAALSSPLTTYSQAVSSLPASPSFHSRVTNAFHGADYGDRQAVPSSIDPTDSPTKRRKIDVPEKSAERERSPYQLSLTSQSQSHSQSSSGSRDLVEQQLTQSLDMDDVHGDNGYGQCNLGASIDSGPSSKSIASEIVESCPPEENTEMYSMTQLSPPSRSQSQSGAQSESQPQPRPQPGSQTRGAVPTAPVLQRRVQRQAWYQLSPYHSLRTRTHSQSQSAILKSGASTPTSQPRSPLQSNLSKSHSESLLQSGSTSPHELLDRSQSQGRLSASGPLFRSGSLQISPAKRTKAASTVNVASQLAAAGQKCETPEKGDGDDAMHLYQDQSPSLAQARKRSNSRIEHFDMQSQLSQYQSQSLSSTDGSSVGSDPRPFSYGFLTQAPYQSQSLSQS